MKKSIIYLITIILIAGNTSCSEEKLGESILNYDTVPETELDRWLETNIRSKYNIQVNYRWEDIESDMTYNLTPCEYEKAELLVKYIKHLWFEAYDELTGNRDFMSTYAPKVMQLIGSVAREPGSGASVLGTAESGMKITLYNVNGLNPDNINMTFLNNYFFKTMHHEFAHILHQTINYSTSFREISTGDYSEAGWINRNEATAWELGFVSAYASKSPDEDFVETIANYVVQSEEWWENMLENGDADKITRKLQMVDEWLANYWNIDIHKLHEIVARRASEIDSI